MISLETLWWSSWITAFAVVGRMHMIRGALHYDLSDLPWSEHELTGAAGRLWTSHMATWNAAHR